MRRNNNKPKNLTAQEVAYIKKNYQTMPIKEIAINLNRSYGGIHRIVYNLQFKKPSYREPVIHYTEDFEEPEKPKIERPPATYSNPQWKNLYY
jgi:hypothetical protein